MVADAIRLCESAAANKEQVAPTIGRPSSSRTLIVSLAGAWSCADATDEKTRRLSVIIVERTATRTVGKRARGTIAALPRRSTLEDNPERAGATGIALKSTGGISLAKGAKAFSFTTGFGERKTRQPLEIR